MTGNLILLKITGFPGWINVSVNRQADAAESETRSLALAALRMDLERSVNLIHAQPGSGMDPGGLVPDLLHVRTTLDLLKRARGPSLEIIWTEAAGSEPFQPQKDSDGYQLTLAQTPQDHMSPPMQK